MVRQFNVAAAVLAGIIATGCGIKGPLVLPPKPAATTAPPAAAPAAPAPPVADPSAPPPARPAEQPR